MDDEQIGNDPFRRRKRRRRLPRPFQDVIEDFGKWLHNHLGPLDRAACEQLAKAVKEPKRIVELLDDLLRREEIDIREFAASLLSTLDSHYRGNRLVFEDESSERDVVSQLASLSKTRLEILTAAFSLEREPRVRLAVIGYRPRGIPEC